MMREISSGDESALIKRGEREERKKVSATMERILKGVPNNDGQT